MSADELIKKFADKQVAEKYAKATGEAKKQCKTICFVAVCRMESSRY